MKVLSVVLMLVLSSVGMVESHGGHHHTSIRRGALEATEPSSGQPPPPPTTTTAVNHYDVNARLGEDGGEPIPGNIQRCGTADMMEEDRKASQLALTFSQFKSKKKLMEQKRGPPRGGKEDLVLEEPALAGDSFNTSKKVIPVCFHVIGETADPYELDIELEALNKAYSSKSCCDPTVVPWCSPVQCSPDTNIQFVMARVVGGHIVGTTEKPSNLYACFTCNPVPVDMTSTENERAVKTALRVGDGRILNIYFAPLSDGLLGYSYFPSILMGPDAVLDGVVVHKDTRVGGNITDYNEGDTLAHEVG